MNNEITELKFSVRFSDCDEFNRLKLSRLFQFTEEAALADAERNGYGFWNMMKSNVGCVITRMKLRLNHFAPLLGENLTVSTWAKENYENKVIYKDYIIRDGSGNILVEGTSSWMLIDLTSGMAMPPSLSPFPIPLCPGDALPEKLEILPMGIFPKVVDHVQGKNTDIDINHHVNHCRYVDWVLDALTKEEMKERGVRSIQLNYIHQVPLGGNVDIVRFKDTNHHAVLFGMNAEDMKKDPLTARCHFQARVGFGD